MPLLLLQPIRLLLIPHRHRLLPHRPLPLTCSPASAPPPTGTPSSLPVAPRVGVGNYALDASPIELEALAKGQGRTSVVPNDSKK
jgi:hypothetical protein